MIITPGATSQSITVQILDDSGLAVTGLVAATFPTTSYERVAEALTGITLSDLAALTSAWSSGGVKEVGGGYYRLDVPDAAFATASKIRIIGEATGKHVLYAVITCAKLAATLGSADYSGNTAQTGDNYARIGAAGGGLTALGDTRIANLDAAVSSRSTYAGGAVASVTAGVTVTTNNDKTGYTASTVSDKTGYSLNLAQVLSVSPTAGTLGQALSAALGEAIGKIVYVPPVVNPGVGSITVYASDGTTVLKTSVVTTDSAGNVLSRV